MFLRISRTVLSKRSITTTSALKSAAKPSTNPSVSSSDRPVDTTNVSLPTKGRRIQRKSRRLVIQVPESFVSTNIIQHEEIPRENLGQEYNDYIPDHVWQELAHSVRAGLTPKGSMASFNHSDHIVLNIAHQGATYLQDTIARQLAANVEADLLVFDRQDFALLAQKGYGKALAMYPLTTGGSEMPAAVVTTIRAHSPSGLHTGAEELAVSENTEDTSELGLDEKEGWPWTTIGNSSDVSDHKINNKIVSQAVSELAWRYTALFERVLQTNKNKEKTSRPRLVYLRDYADMHDTFGSLMLKALMSAVEEIKQRGQQIIVLAGCSPTLHPSTSSNGELTQEEGVPILTGMKYLTVHPRVEHKDRYNQWIERLQQDTATRIAEINARQLIAVYNQKNILSLNLPPFQQDLVQQLKTLDGAKDTLWSVDEVDRRVSTAVGLALQKQKPTIEASDFAFASRIVQQSVALQKRMISLLDEKKSHLGVDGGVDMKSLRAISDEYESRLLTRIVDPTKIQCSFRDVQAPPLTVETLQTLISLPLVRPDLFQRGILKKNFISGVLLFGPPGTGKTMLAKAVAKESGSRMIEIQASDVYEMYVGEGEKNVKAIFSLARKLSPCVIFIDEVDSLMNRRRSEATSNAHREVINQFMVEWDGLTSNNQGVMVMAATNRPFDLDDAVLRRMPRRILVDLPKEEDRVAILQGLLRDEQHDVSVKELAQLTNHYSGSDLKNLCVTAVLRAVQQEVTLNVKQRLDWSHFREALKMVPASSSEDMESLVEIRKWAQSFGDGDKKKRAMIGFS